MNYMFYAHSCTAGNSCASPAVPIRMRKTKVAYLSIRKIAWVLEYLHYLYASWQLRSLQLHTRELDRNK